MMKCLIMHAILNVHTATVWMRDGRIWVRLRPALMPRTVACVGLWFHLVLYGTISYRIISHHTSLDF